MNRFIEHFVEPRRLLLYWQAQDSASRSRYYVGQLTRQNGKVALEYDSQGTEFSEALTLGFQGYPAFDLRQTVHDHQVLEAFMRRLPPRSRQDFGRYLELRGIPKAVRLKVGGNTLGYVPRGYLSMIHRMWENGARVEGEVFRVNGTVRRPLVYVLTRIVSGGRASGSNSHYAVAS